MKNIEFTSDFELALQLMNESKQMLFITGKAGTGKSTLLKYFKKKTAKEAVYLAPTGLAAVNIGGQTIHSFFKFPPRPFDFYEIKKPRTPKLFQKLESIVIDEVSMLRADLLDAIDYFLRKYGPDFTLPFGGIQMIFIGDLFQLPPVVRREQWEVLSLRGYKTPYFFSAHCMQEFDLTHIELTKVFRQKEAAFLSLLNQIRDKSIDREGLETINACTKKSISHFQGEAYIHLCTTNAITKQINQKKLKDINANLYTFQGKIEGDFDERNLPCDFMLSLKEGAQVMFCRNDSDGRWVNGTIGKIKHLDLDKIEVEIKKEGLSFTYEIKQESWELFNFVYNAKESKIEHKVIGSFKQYPLKLAWAITIHKSQGMTFKRVVIDFGRRAFSPGQVYVALSRCVSLDGIVLTRPIRPQDIILDGKIVEYASQHDIL